MALEPILAKTAEYLTIPAVVGYEGPFMDHLADDFNIPGYDVEKGDGILVVRKKGSQSPQIVTAHLDRNGIVVNDAGNFEYAVFNLKRTNGDKNNAPEGVFKKSGERFIGELVYAYGTQGDVMAEGIVRDFYYNYLMGDLFFGIEGMGCLPAGTPIAYRSQLVREKGIISSQIDNAISVAVARQLVSEGFDGTLFLAAGEEVGRSWKNIADYLTLQDIESHEILTLDTTPYTDSRAISQGLVVLRNQDSKGRFNPDLVARLRSRCKTNEIPHEMKDEVIEAENAQLEEGAKLKSMGITELGRIVEHTDGRFNGATVQLPTTRYHTNHETTSELAVEMYHRAVSTVLE
jgi:putative aminopeptidase FrvX